MDSSNSYRPTLPSLVTIRVYVVLKCTDKLVLASADLDRLVTLVMDFRVRRMMETTMPQV